MASAEITPTSVSTADFPATLTAGSVNRRYKKLLIEGAKATQDDWINLGDYLESSELDNIHSIYATVDDDTNTALDTWTYTNSTGSAALVGSTTGTARVTVVYYK